MRLKLLFTLNLICLILFISCTSTKDLEKEKKEKPVDSLYNDALKTALEGKFKVAAPKFEEVERQHPYSIWAVKAHVMSAWSFYADNNYLDAESSLNRFIELYPADPLTEYAYYLLALCYYEQIVDVERDALMTRRALNAFEEVLVRFPNGSYSGDSKLKAELTRSHLAGKEMAVGRFYLNKGFYNSALNRFNNVIRNYDKTYQIPEALYRIIETYLSLGLTKEAVRTQKVSNYNYPDSIWTKRGNNLLNKKEEIRKNGFFNLF